MKADVSVSSMQLRALCEGIEHLGVPYEELLVASNIDAARLDDPNAWFAVEELDQLMRSAVRLSRDPAFGLRWGASTPLAQFDQLTTLAATAPSLRSVVTIAGRFQAILATRREYHFVEDEDHCTMRCDVLASSELGRRVRSEFLIAAMRRLLQYFGAAQEITRVTLPFPRPPHGAAYEQLFGSIVRFEEPALCVEFARASLDRPRGLRDAELHEHLVERVEARRRKVLGQLTFTEQTERVIRDALPEALSMPEAAAALDMSVRSLRRRLAENRTDFSSLTDRVRCGLAEELLATGTRTLKQIADEAGYSNLSSFYRAFRRWTGATPASRRMARARDPLEARSAIGAGKGHDRGRAADGPP